MSLNVQYLVVHTAAFDGRNCDAAMIDRWHRDQGWAGIGYHFVIINDRHDTVADGTLQRGRAKDRPGAHVAGLNTRSLGICCVGHGDRRPHTEKQRQTLLGLLSGLMDEYNVPVENVIGHREVNALVARGVVQQQYRTTKSCPGSMVSMDEIRQQLRQRREPAVDPAVLPGVAGGNGPSKQELKDALGVLARVPVSTFPNAHVELRQFLLHPEVRELRGG
jgi:N-acetylmuramoyl-L-alanine amidase